MRKAMTGLAVACCLAFAGLAEANTLRDRPPTIFYPEGHYLEGWPRKTGRDMFGYNYQQHFFRGSFANVYLGGDGYPPYWGNTDMYYKALVLYGYAGSAGEAEAMMNEWWYWDLRDVQLWMVWNDAWLSNQDRGDDNMGSEPDGNLDRHYGHPSYFDSGAELVQFQVEPIEIECNGRTKKVFLYYYSKIVAVPSTAVLVDGVWHTGDGVEIGPEIYGAFAKVRQYLYDPLEQEDPCKNRIASRIRGAWAKGLCDLVRPDPACKPARRPGRK